MFLAGENNESTFSSGKFAVLDLESASALRESLTQWHQQFAWDNDCEYTVRRIDRYVVVGAKSSIEAGESDAIARSVWFTGAMPNLPIRIRHESELFGVSRQIPTVIGSIGHYTGSIVHPSVATGPVNQLDLFGGAV
jgi:hypothetical protein